MSLDEHIALMIDVISTLDPCELVPRLVLMEHEALVQDSEVYQAIWSHMDSRQRSHWKAILDRYRAIQVCK